MNESDQMIEFPSVYLHHYHYHFFPELMLPTRRVFICFCPELLASAPPEDSHISLRSGVFINELAAGGEDDDETKRPPHSAAANHSAVTAPDAA